MRAAIYTRVSLDPTGRARSVGEQEAECRAVVERENWALSAVFTDNHISASRYSRKKRPEFQRLIDHVEGGNCDVLVTWEASRFTRDLKVYVELRDLCRSAGVLWCYSGRTHDLSRTDDRFSTGLDALLAERESDQTRDRILRTMRHQAVKGRPHGRLLYGQRRVYDPQTRELVRVELDPAQTAILHEVADRFLAGESFYLIARDLTERAVPTPHGAKRWYPTNLSRLMRNPSYIGKRVHQGEVVADANWPTVFDADTWRQLQSTLTDPARNPHRPRSTTRHLLTGIAVCGIHDAPVRLVKNRGYPAYGCPVAWDTVRRQTHLDTYVSEAVIAWMERAKAEGVDPIPTGHDVQPAELSRIQTELDAVSARLDDLYAEARSGAVSMRALATIEPGLLAEVDRLNRRRVRLTIPRRVVGLISSDDIAAAFYDLDTVHQRAAIREIVVPAILPVGKGTRTFRPESVDLRWRLTARAE